MLAFTDITVKTKKESETVGSYEVAPLPKGYGHTLANSLRRILLSSLEGCAITSIKIKDIKHEYSTIEGIKEDVVEIILNLKNIKFKMLSDDPQICHIDASGVSIIKASDIVVSGSVQVVTGDVEIAHLTTKSSCLSMEIVVEKGVGYRGADESGRNEIGRLPLDADFSPVKNVMIEVGKARKGQETELDSVLVEITTDGSIAPKEALLQSAKILQDFSGKVMIALGLSKLEVEELALSASTTPVDVVVVNPSESNESLNLRIEDLAISKRSKTGLLNGGYDTVGSLANVTKKELAKLPGFGAKSLNEVITLLQQYGIILNEE